MAMQVGACCKSASAALPVVGLRAELSGDSAATSSSSRSRVGKRGDRGGALVVRASSVGNKFGSVSFFGQGVCNTARSSFAGDRHLTAAVWSVPHGAASGFSPMVVMAKPVIQFIRGINEQSIPDVRLTRSRDGSNGVANFVFDTPSVFDSSRELGDITGIYMIDDEGVLTSVDVSAKFVNGKPAKIEARYVMRNLKEWDRFMRFMERYAGENELGFVKS